MNAWPVPEELARAPREEWLARPEVELPQGSTFDVVLDFVNHQLVIETSDGGVENITLKAKAVADFYNEFIQRLQRLGIDIHIWTMPSEIENAIPFDRDSTHVQYDHVYAQKFWLALLQANRVMNEFRARFIGRLALCISSGEASTWR